MRLTVRQRWIDLLGWIADRPLGSAVAATAMLLFVAAFIRPPVVDGALVDQLAGANEHLAIAQRISEATGSETSAAIILTPGVVSVGEVFDNLGALRVALSLIDQRIELRSIDEAEAQLFAYELTRDSAVSELLLVLRSNPLAASIISQEANRFLAVVSLPADMEPNVLGAISAHDWQDIYIERAVLSATQLERDVATSLARDLRLLIPVIVAVTLIALLVAFRHWRALLLPFFASIASTVATFALFSAAVVSINLVTLIALPVVLIVGLANSCHFLSKSDAAVSGDHDVAAVVRITLQRVAPPFFFSSLTTAIALASLGFNDLRPIANLGLLSAGALVIVFALVLLAAPLSLRLYLSGSGQSWQASRPYALLSNWMARWRAHISALLLLGMLAGAVAAPLLTVKSDPRAFFPNEAPFAVNLAVFEQEFYFFSPLQVLVSGPDGDRLASLRAAGSVRESLASHPAVRRVDLRPARNSDTAYVLDALLASEESLPSVRRLLDDNAQAGGIDLVYSNASLVYGDIDRQAMESLLRSLGWSVALIFAAILLVFRSVRAMLAAMLANAVPLMLVCAAVWLVGNPLNLVTVFVFLVALGIIVDDSIHILFWRASGDKVAGSSIEFSVLLSTFMLCLGLLLCQLSGFPTTRQFAAYCGLALVGAVVSNLTVLPLLLGSRSDVEVLDR